MKTDAMMTGCGGIHRKIVLLSALSLVFGAFAGGTDWLLDPSSYKADARVEGDALVLDNGLVRRVMTMRPGVATTSFKCLATDEELVRGISPEARVTFDGKEYEVGGMTGQPILNYFTADWLAKMKPTAGAYVLAGVDGAHDIEARFEWKRHPEWSAREMPWPAKGRHVVMHYRAPDGKSLPSIDVHYEIYDGIPLVSKWLTVSNGTDKAVKIDSFTVDELRLSEASGQFDIERFPVPYNLHVISNYGYDGFSWRGDGNHAVRYAMDPAYKTQEHYRCNGIHRLVCSPEMGPAVTIKSGETFEAYRVWELVFDSTERERRGLAMRRMYRVVAPWTCENPLMFHKTTSKPDDVRAAIKQCKETGFETIIMSFGSRFNLESKDPKYRALYKSLADEARAEGIILGGYSLTSSRNAGTRADNVHNPSPRFRRGPCLGSRWGRDYHETLKSFMKGAGFGIFENDGPYPGDWCDATNHPYHAGKEDSIWVQWRAQSDLYRFCRANGIFVNQPDGYFLEGGNKTGGGYKETNWSLPRDYQVIIERQNVYDNNWTLNTSMHWMFVPLKQYHGGGAAATVEPLSQHLDHYSSRFANLLGAGIQACWRGPRLYDTPETLAVVKKWVKFYKDNRAVLDGDMIHLRRPDGRDWDGWVMVDPTPGKGMRAIASLFNPLATPIRRRVTLPLYYSGLSGEAEIAVGDCAEFKRMKLDSASKVELEVEIPAKGHLHVFCRSLSSAQRLFADPPSEYGVSCWWWWLNGNVTRDAIVKDLDAMKSRHFQGAMIFDAGGANQRGHKQVPRGPLFGSPEWCALFRFALDEAEKRGLEISFNIQSGWNLGGPFVDAKHAAKQLVFSECIMESGKPTAKMKRPKKRGEWYRDVAVYAFPVDEAKTSAEPIYHLSAKLGLVELGGSAPDCRFLLANKRRDNAKSHPKPYLVESADIVDLTDKMSPDGTLDWKVPSGRWMVLRIGETLTGARVSTCSQGSEGLVLDYMSRDAFDFYWEKAVEPILKAAGPHVGKTLRNMETDSWECGGMNWTSEFRPDRRLVSLAGVVVDGMDSTHKFLADWRKAIAKAVEANHYARFAERAHKVGMGIQPESAGPHAGPLDGLKNYSHSDVVMSEFWAPSPHRPRWEDRFFVKQAASSSHVLPGRRIVGAEAFTTIGPQWNDRLWYGQKAAFDHEICSGLTRVYLHTYTCSPDEMGEPGQEYFAGTHSNRHVTWWDDSDGYFDYMRRVQSIVQRGTFVADVLYYYGDHVPNVYPFKEHDAPGVLPGYDYDVVDEDTLSRLSVRDGRIVAPSGLEYRVLILPESDALSASAGKSVARLQSAGGLVIRKGAEWKRGLPPDCSFAGKPRDFDYIHYRLDGNDFYFVHSAVPSPMKTVCEFRVTDRQPELWNPLDGTRRLLGAFETKDKTTAIPLEFNPNEAYFIVFTDAKPKRTGSPNFAKYEPVCEIGGPWKVWFDPARGGCGEVEFASLRDWTKSADDRVKFYSGSAVYRRKFDCSAKAGKGERLLLDLGEVLDVGIARVTMNGKGVGTVWTKPFRVDVTDALRESANELEMRVVNSWYNRVLGDQLKPSAKPFSRTNIRISKKSPSPSGLLGPVRILRRSR